MKQRIITAVIAAAVFLPLVIIGGWPLLSLVYIMATIGLYELIRMKKGSVFTFSSILSFILLWIILLPEELLSPLADAGFDKSRFILIAVLLYLMSTVVTKNKFTFDNAGFMLIAVIYTGAGFYYMFETREAELLYIFYALFTIWATDSGAYFIGKALGKRKLWPEISPNKTVEGFAGGVAAALAVGLLFLLLTDLENSALKLLGMSVLIAVFGQMGDLVQSAYKRHYGVKDSGSLLPGHGGILDRFDSLIFILPILHLFNLIG